MSLSQTDYKSTKILENYPDKIPVILHRDPKSNMPDIDKKKYLVPMELTLGQFIYVIRKRMKLPTEKSMFLFVDNVLPPTGEIMSVIYESHKNKDDNFLHMTYTGENCFGEYVSKHCSS